MKLVWLRKARLDLDDAIAWLGERNQSAANRVLHEISIQVSQLKVYPQLGRVGQVTETRELVIRHTRYIAPYRINFDLQQIEVLALMHESQQWPESFN